MRSISENIKDELDLVMYYCIFDDLVDLLKLNSTRVGRKSTLTLSEIAVISCIRSRYKIKELKSLYKLLQDKYSTEFNLPCYKNFVVQMNNSSTLLLYLVNILLRLNRKYSGSIKLVDATSIPVCRNIRINQHKVMKDIATRGKDSIGWFYGLKLHAISDIQGNPLYLKFTTASYPERKVLDKFLEEITESIIVADAGYTSKDLEKKANINNNTLKTCKRNNMKVIATLDDINLLNMRNRIETLFSVLKERQCLITSLPRSVLGYFSHYIHTIFGYMMNKAIVS